MKAAYESQLTSRRRRCVSAQAVWSAVLALAAGLTLRLWMLFHFFEVGGDSLIYGGIAKNLLLHGRYALSISTGYTYPTLIRLPGYPLFLALCFRLFGIDHYAPAAWIQIALDLAGCLLLADFVRRIASPGAALCALWLAALCPFTAVYAAEPLTEGPTLFFIVLALWAMVRFDDRPGWSGALWFTFAATSAAILRPDGALVAIALLPALLIALRRNPASVRPLRLAVVCTLLALAPFAAWTWRNWRAFHIFQPLAPRLATDPGEDPHLGWERWVKTWCLDFVSTYQIYWNVPGDVLDASQLPHRAFDSPAQRAETFALANDYNQDQLLTPDIDARFGRLADQRIAAHPWRYYVWLPFGRLADMWVRPRVENLPIDLDWWVYSHHRQETRIGWAYVALNALYLLLGIVGLCLRPRLFKWMLLYLVLRSALLLTVEAPEARYTLECFPMLFALGGVALYRLISVGFGAVLKVKASPGNG